MKEYLNTKNDPLRVREYGRMLQQMADRLTAIEDRDKRNRLAQHLLRVMTTLAPELKEQVDWEKKLWEHLYWLSNCKLELDFPIEVTKPTEIQPARVKYNSHRVRHRQFGANVELMIKEACEMEPGEKQQRLIVATATVMKQYMIQTNGAGVEDDTVYAELYKLSSGRLRLNKDEVQLPPAQRLTVKQQISNKNLPAYERKKKEKKLHIMVQHQSSGGGGGMAGGGGSAKKKKKKRY